MTFVITLASLKPQERDRKQGGRGDRESSWILNASADEDNKQAKAILVGRAQTYLDKRTW